MKIIKHPSSGSLYIFSEEEKKIVECFFNYSSQQVEGRIISIEEASEWLKEQIHLTNT